MRITFSRIFTESRFSSADVCVTARIAAPAAWALVDLWLDLRHDPSSSYGEKLAEIEDCEVSR